MDGAFLPLGDYLFGRAAVDGGVLSFGFEAAGELLFHQGNHLRGVTFQSIVIIVGQRPAEHDEGQAGWDELAHVCFQVGLRFGGWQVKWLQHDRGQEIQSGDVV